jgi:hypothetical protein
MDWSATIYLKLPSLEAWEALNLGGSDTLVFDPVASLNTGTEYFTNVRVLGTLPAVLEPFIQPVPEYPKQVFM